MERVRGHSPSRLIDPKEASGSPRCYNTPPYLRKPCPTFFTMEAYLNVTMSLMLQLERHRDRFEQTDQDVATMFTEVLKTNKSLQDALDETIKLQATLRDKESDLRQKETVAEERQSAQEKKEREWSDERGELQHIIEQTLNTHNTFKDKDVEIERLGAEMEKLRMAQEAREHDWNKERNVLNNKIDEMVVALKEKDQENTRLRERVNLNRGMEFWLNKAATEAGESRKYQELYEQERSVEETIKAEVGKLRADLCENAEPHEPMNVDDLKRIVAEEATHGTVAVLSDFLRKVAESREERHRETGKELDPGECTTADRELEQRTQAWGQERLAEIRAGKLRTETGEDDFQIGRIPYELIDNLSSAGSIESDTKSGADEPSTKSNYGQKRKYSAPPTERKLRERPSIKEEEPNREPHVDDGLRIKVGQPNDLDTVYNSLLDFETQVWVMKSTERVRSNSIAANRYGRAKCLYFQTKIRSGSAKWTNKSAGCDHCQRAGRQCVFFVDQETVVLASATEEDRVKATQATQGQTSHGDASEVL